MSIEHISTNFMITNSLTKGLPPKTFNKHVFKGRELLGIVNDIILCLY